MEVKIMGYHTHYTIEETCRGYIIRSLYHNNGCTKKVYLVSIYNGKPTWYFDYLYAKHYKTEKSALAVIDRLKRCCKKEVTS